MSLYMGGAWKAAHGMLLTKKTRIVLPMIVAAIGSAFGIVGDRVVRWVRKKH